MAKMQIAPEQGQLLMFWRNWQAMRRYIEVGVFTGHSSLAMALTIPDDGEIVACITRPGVHHHRPASLAGGWRG